MIKVTLSNEILKYITEIDKNRYNVSSVKLSKTVANKLRKNSKKKSSYASNKIEGNPLSENILKGVFKIKMGNWMSMFSARAVLVVIAVLGVVLAWNEDSSVFRVVSFAWAGFGATFGPVMLTALFWKRSTKFGAIAGMIVGGVMVFVWKFKIAALGGVFAIYELLPAFVAALFTIIVVSMLTPAPDPSVINEFEEVKKELHE